MLQVKAQVPFATFRISFEIPLQLALYGVSKYCKLMFIVFLYVGDFIEVYNELGNGSGTNTTSAAGSAANTTSSAATGASAAVAATKDSSTEASGSTESRASRKATKLHLG
jgi:hypothetical protein